MRRLLFGVKHNQNSEYKKSAESESESEIRFIWSTRYGFKFGYKHTKNLFPGVL